MLAEERFSEILRIVNEQRSATVQELTELLETSESTIRRDLTTLHKRGSLIKVHGGATALNMGNMTKDAAVSIRQDLNIEEKVTIAKYAATLVEPDDFVYIDAGTSTELLIDYIAEEDTVFVTNAIGHAKKLSERGRTVYLLGGKLKASTEAIVGAEAVESLEKYNFSKGFFGTNGIQKESGLTTPDTAEALVKKKAMKHCRQCYILADPSKFNQVSAVTFASLNEGVILTTKLQDSSYQKYKNIKEVE